MVRRAPIKKNRDNRDGLNHREKKGGHGTWGALWEAPFLDLDPPTGEFNPRDPNYGGNEL